MDIRKICPAAVNGVLSRVSRTQPVPSIAACFAGSARTAKMASAGALMTVVALTLSSATWLPPHELSLSPVLTFAKSGTNRWRRHHSGRGTPLERSAVGECLPDRGGDEVGILEGAEVAQAGEHLGPGVG